MNDSTVRVFVNAVGLDVPIGSSVIDAVRAWRTDEADAVSRGTKTVTDSRGLPLAGTDPVYSGAILRVIGARAVASAEES